MKFLVKTEKGYVSYFANGEYAYTQFRDDAKIYSDCQADRIKKDLVSKGLNASKVVAQGKGEKMIIIKMIILTFLLILLWTTNLMPTIVNIIFTIIYAIELIKFLYIIYKSEQL